MISLKKTLKVLTLTADFSHWVCVHSNLSDKTASLAEAMAAAGHIHAFIGFDEGPQVSDPRNLAHQPWLALLTSWWRSIIQLTSDDGYESLTIAPAFGPAPYMPLSGKFALPVGDAREINCWMMSYLRSEFASMTL